jgi:hypothetical protein
MVFYARITQEVARELLVQAMQERDLMIPVVGLVEHLNRLSTQLLPERFR